MAALLKLLRPQQWTKNLFCFAGLLFSGRLRDGAAIVDALWIFALFCALSGAVYALNDILDVERDRYHPKKKHRPLPSGKVSLPIAWMTFFVLLIGALTGGYFLGLKTWVCLLLYLILNIGYSFWFKHQPLLDVTCIALGFVLRLLAGVYAIAEFPTSWITLCTFFLALFLGFAKRRSELADLEVGKADSQRPVLSKYTPQLLDSLVNSAATITVMSYALFTATSGKNPSLVITVPIVYYAIMHYKMRLAESAGTEEPDKMLIHDKVIRASVLLWLACYLAIMYGDLHLFR